MTELEYGVTYYQVTFADPKLTMPGLKPMIYIGKNIFSNEKEDTYYFQDTVSVICFGLVGEAENSTDCHISSFPEDEIGTCVVDINTAAQIVSDAANKYKALGCPKVTKAKGEWQ